MYSIMVDIVNNDDIDVIYVVMFIGIYKDFVV